MKNILITLILLFGAMYCNAQQVELTLKDGTKFESEVETISSKAILTKKGLYKYDQIQSVEFIIENPRHQKYYDKITAAGVEVSFRSDSDGNYLGTQQQLDSSDTLQMAKTAFGPVNNPGNVEKELATLKYKLDMFRTQRTTGKGLQLAGLAVSTLAFVITDEDGNANVGVAIGGSVLSLIGFFIDMGASQHLRQ
ncbi:MAG: hypothetical protein NXI20_17745 [bacterium]|nr:hypothetical protein [bacterium]